MRIILPILLCVCGLASPAFAQDWQPREVAANVAQQIEENYFDVQKAAEVGAELRTTAASGAFDGIDDPFRLATALSNVISPYDGHFGVSWSPTGDDSAGQLGRETYDFADQIRRAGYGFRQVATLPANIGYFAMTNFANIDFDDPNDPARRRADAALALVSGSDAIIIDLRDNGGGSPAMVGYLASAFTAAEADIYNRFIGRQGESSEAPAIYYPTPRLNVPLFVLISAGTGSAAEAFAYTMQAAGRATIVGEASAGAANPGGTVDAGDGFGVFVSFGSPRNPVTGTNWEGDGVQPDIAVPAGDALLRAQRIALDGLADTIDAAYRNDIAWARSALTGAHPVLADPAAYAGDYGPMRVVAGDGGLILQYGRRPAIQLIALGNDLFYRSDNPLVRYRFTRDGGGAVEAIEFLNARGSVSLTERSD